MAIHKDAAKLERRAKEREERAHSVAERRAWWRKRERNKRIFNWTLLGLIVIVIVYGLYVLWTSDDPSTHDGLAKCLSSKGATMHGTEWCPHCQEQKQLFDRSFRFVNYVNCDVSPLCKARNVTTYPTWILDDGTMLVGLQSLQSLADRTGCKE
jgi:hypothetical protein